MASDLRTDNKLIKALNDGSLTRVIDLIKTGADVNARDKEQSTALIMAATTFNPQEVNYPFGTWGRP